VKDEKKLLATYVRISETDGVKKYAKGTTNGPGKEATMHDTQVEPTIAAPEPPRVGSHMTFFMYVS